VEQGKTLDKVTNG
jgi:hypothetical protein